MSQRFCFIGIAGLHIVDRLTLLRIVDANAKFLAINKGKK